MQWILAGLASSVATFLVNNLTSKPTITIASGEVKSDEQTTLFKYGFYGLAGVLALLAVRKLAK